MDNCMRDTINLIRNLIKLTAENAASEEIRKVWQQISRINDGLHTPNPPPPPSKRRQSVRTPRWYGQQFYEATSAACVIALTHTHTVMHLLTLERHLVHHLAEPLQ